MCVHFLYELGAFCLLIMTGFLHIFQGTAEVVFSRRTDAVAAVKRYNNVQLDGKPMKIEIIGTNLSTPASIPQVTNGLLGNPNGVPRRYILLKNLDVPSFFP